MLNSWVRLALCGFLVGGLIACKINPKESVYYPKIGGNTFDLQNRLDVALPRAERINISYEFEQTEDSEDDVEAEGIYEGTVWWFQERSAQDPEQFLAIHLLTETGEFEVESRELVKLSRTDYDAQNLCIDLENDPISPDIAPLIESLQSQEFPISTDIYVRRFVLRNGRETDEGIERTDIIYVRDIVRAGYTCEFLGDLDQPRSDVEAIVKEIKALAVAAFEVMT